MADNSAQATQPQASDGQRSIPPIHDLVSLILAARESASQLRSSNPELAQRQLQLADFLEAGATQNAIQLDLERQRSALAAVDSASLERYRFQFEWHLENTRALVQLSQGAMRAATLVNAGAAVAILAFLGSNAGEGVQVSEFAGALAWFAGGVVAATIATGAAYWSQLLYGNSDEKLQQRGKWPHRATVILYVLAIISFGLGCWKTYTSFLAAQPRENIVSTTQMESVVMPDKPRAPTPLPQPPPEPRTDQPVPFGTPPERKTIIAPPPPAAPLPKVPTQPPPKPPK